MAETQIIVRSHRAEVEGKITDNLREALKRIGVLVTRQAKDNADQPRG